MSARGFEFQIEKASATGRYVTGWLAVAEKDGAPTQDTQDDRWSIEEVRKSCHAYMQTDRIIKAHHAGEKIGQMIEIMVIDDDVAKALGMTTTKRGAWGTAEITCEKTQEQVRKGKFSGFSPGGRGKRTKIEKKRSLTGAPMRNRGMTPGGSKKLRANLWRERERLQRSLGFDGSKGHYIGRATSYLVRRQKGGRTGRPGSKGIARTGVYKSVDVLYEEIAKAGLIKPGKPSLVKRIGFLASTMSGARGDRNSKIGRYLESRKQGRGYGAPGKRRARKGTYTGVYATGVNKSLAALYAEIDKAREAHAL